MINLLGFAVSAQALPTSAIPQSILPTITKILENFTLISRLLILAEAILGALILFTFERIGSKKKDKILRLSAILLLLATLLPAVSTLFSLNNLPFPLSEKILSLVTGILTLFLGIALLRVKANWEVIASALGLLTILQSIVLLSTFYLPVRLLEFSIPIALIEAVFFYKSQKL